MYAYEWSKRTFNSLYQSYPRATYFLLAYWPITASTCVKWLQKSDQSPECREKWEAFRWVVRVLTQHVLFLPPETTPQALSKRLRGALHDIFVNSEPEPPPRLSTAIEFFATLSSSPSGTADGSPRKQRPKASVFRDFPELGL